MAKSKRQRCKVFSATLARARETLGETFNAWHDSLGNPVVDRVDVLQSSDSEFHCLSLVVWYEG